MESLKKLGYDIKFDQIKRITRHQNGTQIDLFNDHTLILPGSAEEIKQEYQLKWDERSRRPSVVPKEDALRILKEAGIKGRLTDDSVFADYYLLTSRFRWDAENFVPTAYLGKDLEIKFDKITALESSPDSLKIVYDHSKVQTLHYNEALIFTIMFDKWCYLHMETANPKECSLKWTTKTIQLYKKRQ